MLRRILFVIGVTLVVMLTLISIATRTVLMEGYSRLEASFMERNVERVQNTVSDELSALSRTANDWAAWDETYRFVKDLNGSYIRGNMGRDTFENLRLSTMLYLNPQARLVFGRMFDAATGALTGAPDSFLAWLAAHPRMTSFERTDSHAESIATLGEGTFLVATRPILDSQLQGPVRGTLVFARPLDSGEVKRLSRSLKLSLSFYPLNDPRLPADGVRAMEIISAHASVSIDTRSQDIINGYAFLRDDQGTPLLLMRVEFPRDIHRQARMTARYFIAWLVVIGVVFSAVVLLMLQKTVLSRLHQLSAGVLAVGTGGGSSRRVSVSGRDQIAYLGAAINGMLDTLASSTAELRQSEQKNAAFLGAIPDLILRVSRHGRVVDVHLPPGFRPLHERWPDLVGRDITDFPGLFPAVPQSLVTEGLNAMARAMESGSPEVFDCPIPSDDGLRHYQARIAASGKEETVVLVRDVTAEKRVEEARRRDVMVKEIHHRVKNNLQVISSLLALQSSSTTDPRTRALLDESRDRVRSMALIHEKLYQAGGGPGAGYAQYVRDLADQLMRSYGVSPDTVTMKIDVDDIPMDMDLSVPIGLIITELVSNALKHGFPDGRRGLITIRMRRVEARMLMLAVGDDGVGWPADIDYRRPASLGLRIVNILAEQIHANLVLDMGAGTTFTLTFPAG